MAVRAAVSAAPPAVLVDVPRDELLEHTVNQRTMTPEHELGEPNSIQHVATARWGELKTLSAVCVGNRVSVYATHHYGLVENHDAAEQLNGAFQRDLLEHPSEPQLAPIAPLLALSGCVRSTPPVPRVTA